jgi:hypothetical protein
MHLQRAAGNAGVTHLLADEQPAESPVKDVVGRGGGSPLDDPVRERMEASFGQDFSDVRVHSGGEAAASARAVDAHAYTVGHDIVLGEGHGPGSAAHERTLAHELTHVVQQRSGPVDGTPAGGGIRISDPADRFERAAEATADSVVSSGRAGDLGAAPAAGAVQREGAPAEGQDQVQELGIQRRQEPEEPVEEVSGPQRPPQPAGDEAAPAAQGPRQTGGDEGPGPAQSVSGPTADEVQEEVQTLALQRQEMPEEEEVQTLALQRQETPEEEEVQTLALQRQETPEEEEVQTLALQRQEMPEEEELL